MKPTARAESSSRGTAPTSAPRSLSARCSGAVLLLIAFMIVFVFSKAWPSFAHNGLAWFGPGGNVDDQLTDIFNSPADPDDYVYELHAWPLLYATFLITGISVVLATIVSVLSAIFIVEFAPAPIAAILQPVVRLLAAVPSVIYGLIGILVLVPFVGNHIISQEQKESVQYVIQLDGSSILVGILVLTVMITPIMVAIIVDALRSVPRNWMEGAAALGVNRWRALCTVGVRAARPAIVAAAILATARALGEAIMLSMVTGSVGLRAEPARRPHLLLRAGQTACLEIVDNAEGLSVKPFGADPLRVRRDPPDLQRLPLLRRLVRARGSMRKYTLQAR